MEEISRIASPMSLCEEDLFDVDHKVDKKKEQLVEELTQPASFLIGSIQAVNDRICNLDIELSSYDGKLAIDSRSSRSEEGRYDPSLGTFQKRSATSKRSSRSAKDKEERDTAEFAGVFRKESEAEVEMPIQKIKGLAKSKSDAPRLVELQQYPGFNATLLTPLPHSLDPTNVIDHVINAQIDLDRKPRYKQEVRAVLYSRIQRAILQDTFWWIFLNKYHPNLETQSAVFKRIARNFIRLFQKPRIPHFRDVFFMAYPDLLTQMVYCTFCHAFPQSWHQFDDDGFKEVLTCTVNMWITGVRPSPHVSQRWNYPGLEPANMRKGDHLSDLTAKPGDVKRGGGGGAGRKSLSSGKSPLDSIFRKSHHSSRVPSSNKRSTSKSRLETNSTVSSQKNKSMKSGVLTPIDEADLTSAGRRSAKLRSGRDQDASSAVGAATQFDHCKFNTSGRSPMLAEFLKDWNIHEMSGCDRIVRRTQIKSLPPRDSYTYHDVISDSVANVKATKRQFMEHYAANMKEHAEFRHRICSEHKSYDAKSQKLLGQPRKVRYLCNLIMLDMKRDQDDTSIATADGAVQQALNAESAA